MGFADHYLVTANDTFKLAGKTFKKMPDSTNTKSSRGWEVGVRTTSARQRLDKTRLWAKKSLWKLKCCFNLNVFAHFEIVGNA